MAPHPLEVADGVTNGVNPHVAHMQPTRWIREHGEDVELLLGALKKQKESICAFFVLKNFCTIFHDDPNLYNFLL